MFRDSPTSLWQSGIYRRTGAPKLARPKWASAAKPLDMINGKATFKGGTRSPTLTVYLREFCANNSVGTHVFTSVGTLLGGLTVQTSQVTPLLAIDCTIRVRLNGLTIAKGKTYTVKISANTEAATRSTSTTRIPRLNRF